MLVRALKNNRNTIIGIFFIFSIVIISYYMSQIKIIKKLHISPLIIGILIGILWTNITNGLLIDRFKNAILICSKYLLRLGIILYGIKINISSLYSVGLVGFLISLIVVTFVILLGYFIGTKVIKLDSDTSILTSFGSGICGAAAVLALDGIIKAKDYKVAVSVSTVVVYGTISMFLYPIFYNLGFVNFNHTQEGFYIGSTVHEVAHVIAASSAISEDTSKTAIIIKMIRVILLIPALIVVNIIKKEKDSKISIPWFAIIFLLVILFNSFIYIPDTLKNIINIICTFCLSSAMVSLGLNTNIKSFKNIGGKAFLLAFILFLILIFGGYLLNMIILQYF